MVCFVERWGRMINCCVNEVRLGSTFSLRLFVCVWFKLVDTRTFVELRGETCDSLSYCVACCYVM